MIMCHFFTCLSFISNMHTQEISHLYFILDMCADLSFQKCLSALETGLSVISGMLIYFRDVYLLLQTSTSIISNVLTCYFKQAYLLYLTRWSISNMYIPVWKCLYHISDMLIQNACMLLQTCNFRILLCYSRHAYLRHGCPEHRQFPAGSAWNSYPSSRWQFSHHPYSHCQWYCFRSCYYANIQPHSQHPPPSPDSGSSASPAAAAAAAAASSAASTAAASSECSPTQGIVSYNGCGFGQGSHRKRGG